METTMRTPRYLQLAVRWPFGVAYTTWHYVWRTTPMKRLNEDGSPAEDLPPPLPADAESDRVQHFEDGVGPLFRRRYRIRLRDTRIGAEELIARLRQDPNQVSPTEFARFEKIEGGESPLSVGDEFVVRMPGPWDGPVRVVETTPRSFR